MRSAALVAAAFLLAACVSLEQSPLPIGSISKDQRTIVAVFPSPGPVMNEADSTADSLAKFVPGMSLVLSATQNTRDLTASDELETALPAWDPAADYQPILLKAVADAGYPGRLVPAAEAGVSAGTLRSINRASDVIDWQLRYCASNPSGERPKIPRDYASTIPAPKDSLVLEVNFEFEAPSDGRDGIAPALASVTKLVRADTMQVLWRREDYVEDKASAKPRTYYLKHPDELLTRYRAMMPQLAQSLSANLALNLRNAGL